MSKKKAGESVKVIVRCRPMNEKEVGQGFERVVEMDTKRGHVSLRNALKQGEPKEFTFDAIYDWNSIQRDLYEESFRSLVESVLGGYNGTIFAYGKTGTGKTFTMEGVRSDLELRGVIPNSFDHIFKHIARTHDQQYLVRASYLEIYQEEIRDLLAKDQKKRLELKERPDTGIYVRQRLFKSKTNAILDFGPKTELFYTEVIGRAFQRFWAENGTVLHRSNWTCFPKTVVTFKQIGYQEIRKMIFITTKIIVGVHILIYFGTSLVVGNNDIPFCRKRLKELREDEKDWSKRCLNGKGQNLDTPRCEAEKEYNHERRCMYTKICFYKEPYAEPYLLIKSKSEIHAIDLTTLNTTIVIGGIAGRTMDIDTMNNKLYIADNNSISRVNLDDICVEVILLNVSVGDMAIDWIGRRIFWTEYLEKQIFVADLSDKKKRVLIKTTSYPSGIAIDATME